jgi:ligand-binding SRPBCC domain-containing protein
MPTFEHTIDIDAPIEHVFAWHTDPTNWQLTMPAMTDLEVRQEIGDETRMDATWTTLGMSTDVEITSRIVEADEHLVSTFEGPDMSGEVHYRFSETDDGTHVVQQADYEFGDSLFDRLVEPVAKRVNKRQFRNSLETARELIEAETEAEIAA